MLVTNSCLMKKRVVITGMGVVSPNGIGNEAFCRAILAGTSGVKRIRSFDPSDLPVQIAGEVQDFDELAWMDAHERKHVSRAVPLALAASTEALARGRHRYLASCRWSSNARSAWCWAQAAARRSSPRSKSGLWLHRQGEAGQPVLHSQRHHGHALQRNQHALRPARHEPRHHHRMHLFDRRTSATRLRQIQFGFLPMMLVGGVDAPIAPGIMKGFTLMKIMTASWNDEPERASRPFSADRDGFVVAEGSWMFVLEEYEHARARGATNPRRGRRLWLHLRGLSSRAPAGVRRRTGARHSDGDGRCRHRRRDVDYVNLHGTSTQLNDRIETRA